MKFVWLKNARYLSVNVFSTKVLIGTLFFYVAYWRRDRHFTWSSEPHEGLAAWSAEGVPSFLSYFKTLSTGPALGIKPATSRSAVKRSTDWADPASVWYLRYNSTGRAFYEWVKALSKFSEELT